jgi:hypothetical protein
MHLSRIELDTRDNVAEPGLDERTAKALTASINNNNNDDDDHNTHLIIFICLCLIFEL